IEPMGPSPEPAGPCRAKEAEPEPEGEQLSCAFLTWSAEEVAEWVAQLGFPQYKVRG
ncbi:SAM15 protein, partial [Calyptomena viridis]|nr:SAM15 protein [Calyptomena viridis]